MRSSTETPTMSSGLTRWSGLALMLSGLLLAVPMLFHPDDSNPLSFQRAAWAPVHTLLIASAVLMLFGLIGLHGAQAARAGTLGLIGFILSFAGGALVVAGLVVDAFVVPAIAGDPAAQALLDPAGPLFGGALGIFFLLMGATFSLGTIVLGIATARAGVLPRWAGALILLGGPLLGFTPPLPTIAGICGAVLLGVGYLSAGYAIWSGQPAGIPASAREGRAA
ncbi:MAG: hypothetical protein IPO81_12040 [Kouleothrix sp.]|nr:hypothetical protein [Kouleothrix sp.]